MIPVDQTRFGRGEGNCWAAAIASILERPLEDFAAFHEAFCLWAAFYEEGRDGECPWEIRVGHRVALAEMGWSISYQDNFLEPMIPRGYAIASGPGPRGCDHATVALDGVIVHDPHPSRDGLLEISYFEWLVPVVWPADSVKLALSEGPHAPARPSPPPP